MTLPRAIVFDIDETLAESFQPPTSEIVDRLEQLLALVPIAIITGGNFARIEYDFLTAMAHHEHLSRLFLFPNSSAECYLYKNGVWGIEYTLFPFSPDEKDHIISMIEQTINEIPEFRDAQYWGQRIVDHDRQIAYTVVGLDAPQEVKMRWDPDRSKRLQFRSRLAEKLPGFNVLVGGSSTIDVTRAGVDKSYGVRWFAEYLGILAGEMLYIGDALFPGGNDYVVIETGIQTRRVNSPVDTLQIMDKLLAM